MFGERLMGAVYPGGEEDGVSDGPWNGGELPDGGLFGEEDGTDVEDEGGNA